MALDALVAHDLSQAGHLVRAAVPAEMIDPDHFSFFLRRAAGPAFAWPRLMVPLAGEPRVIGNIGFHGPPANGVAEIGYTVFAPYRRQGYATEAARALFDWAAGSEGVTRVRASVAPTNAASLAVVRKLGLHQVGTRTDERDGEELVFEADWPAGAG